MRHAIAVCLLFTASLASASGLPFDVPASHPTLREIQGMHSLVKAGQSERSGGFYRFDVSGFDSPGLLAAVGQFDDQGRLVSIMATYDKSNYQSLTEELAGSYRLTSSRRDAMGGQVVEYAGNGYRVTVNAPVFDPHLTVRLSAR